LFLWREEEDNSGCSEGQGRKLRKKISGKRSYARAIWTLAGGGGKCQRRLQIRGDANTGGTIDVFLEALAAGEDSQRGKVHGIRPYSKRKLRRKR